ncbi:hypothetical protein HOLleu_15299 [Holothuria leucospilota]|uniref:BRICHOS domain-containing protein n=1 Tax=Holothuria leucospilota TaxID=206669 RepID=A0A9Q1C8X1_HOLLE|nr:hypothetical protein HOLleu_15299 [Holothuria leucospilota]
MASEKSKVTAEMGEQSLVYHKDGKYHQLKLKLFGTFLITTVLVAGFVCVVYIQSTVFEQLNTHRVKTGDDSGIHTVVEEDDYQHETLATTRNPRIYFFEEYIEDVKIWVDLDRDLTILKNISSGDCFLTKNENVPLVSRNGKINEDVRLDIVKIEDTEQAIGKADVLQYDEKEIIPPGYLTATIHEAADKMCVGHDSFWADKNENGKVIPRNRRQVQLRPLVVKPYCCEQTYLCCKGVYLAWCVKTVCPCYEVPDEDCGPYRG